jgi:hypothetical protein
MEVSVSLRSHLNSSKINLLLMLHLQLCFELRDAIDEVFVTPGGILSWSRRSHG